MQLDCHKGPEVIVIVGLLTGHNYTLNWHLTVSKIKEDLCALLCGEEYDTT